jgi:hypothetical protein
MGARGPEVDDLDRDRLLGDKDDVLRLQIRVNDPAILEERQRVEELPRDVLDERKRDAREIAALEDGIEVERQRLQHSADVSAEHERVEELGDARRTRVRGSVQADQDRSLMMRLLLK